jgi:uncharacterized protein
MSRKTLLDVNVLIALLEPDHDDFDRAQAWFRSLGQEDWGICPITEIGYVRIATNPSFAPGARTYRETANALDELARHPNFRYWPITDTWAKLTASFAARITGHQQITDAYLLGMAIKEDGVLVTFDRGLKYLAGPQFSKNLLVLE